MEMPEITLFCANLRKYRQDMRITQASLALRSGYCRTYICALEKGKVNPTLQTVILLSRELGVEPYYLFMNCDSECDSVWQ